MVGRRAQELREEGREAASRVEACGFSKPASSCLSKQAGAGFAEDLIDSKQGGRSPRTMLKQQIERSRYPCVLTRVS